ncbi:MAG: hypothetical protein NTX65_13545 [Ignavibacteriales bacterium]|nr:hypothetical protein [Ignavibacteriales bacterium]
MFEREIKFIYDFNLNKVNRLGPYFTFEQLLASDVHPAILQYISAEIDYLIYEDRQKLLKNSLFDYSGEKISFLFNQISEEAKKSKRFAQEYIAKLILHASSFTVNYLVRPKWTLTKFVFDEDNHKSTNDIKQILNYVYYYKYVNKILVSYINSKKILSMNAQEFEELLNKADKLGVETYLPAILSNALKSMAEFFNIGEIQKSKIPLSAVEMFLGEKELIKHLQKVGETFVDEEGAKFNLSDYQKVFNSIIIEKEELMIEPEATQKFETKEAEEAEVVEELELVDHTIENNVEEILHEEEEQEEQKVDRSELEEGLEREDLEEEQEQETEEDDQQEEEIEIRGMNESANDKIDDETEDEITIAPPAKWRIKINEDNRIEPIIETTDELNENEKEIVELTEEPNENEKDMDDITEEIEEEENREDDDEIQSNNKLDLDKKEFLEENPDNESFLQSLRDNENGKQLPDINVAELEEDTFKFDEKRFNSNIDEDDEDIFNKKKLKSEDGSERVIFENENADNVPPTHNKNESDENSRVDLAEILENKEMTKIIEVIFDYDIEDFASLLDEISNCRNSDDATLVINETLSERHISRSSKEAEAFKSIISEYFGNK